MSRWQLAVASRARRLRESSWRAPRATVIHDDRPSVGVFNSGASIRSPRNPGTTMRAFPVTLRRPGFTPSWQHRPSATARTSCLCDPKRCRKATGRQHHLRTSHLQTPGYGLAVRGTQA